MAFFLALLISCKRSDFSLEQCALQLLEEKYSRELSDVKISSIKANRIQVEAATYKCGSIEEMCKPGDIVGMSSGLYVNVFIESSGNYCKVVEDHSMIEECRIICPTPTPSPEPESGNPVLFSENVQTKIEINPKLKITLHRSACMGSCPNYTVTAYGDGKVVYEGENFVPTEGIIEKQIPKDQLQRIVTALEVANFFGFVENPNRIVVLDSSDLSISLETDGKIYQIRDGGICSYVNIPGRFEFCDLGDKIDEILETPW